MLLSLSAFLSLKSINIPSGEGYKEIVYKSTRPPRMRGGGRYLAEGQQSASAMTRAGACAPQHTPCTLLGRTAALTRTRLTQTRQGCTGRGVLSLGAPG